MLVEFRVKNFRSFADEAFVQFDSSVAFKERPENLITAHDVSLLKCLAIYGANASGKSNVVAALRWMRHIVLSSAKNNSTDRIETFPFAFDRDLTNAPTLVEIRFLFGEMYYRYGFEVSASEVVSEWLLWSRKFNGKDWIVFTRDGDRIEYGNSYRGDRVSEKEILKNTLLLSKLDQANVDVATLIMRGFKDVRIVSGLDDWHYLRATIEMLEDAASRDVVLAFTQLADYTIEGISQREDQDLPVEYLKYLERHKLPKPQEIGLLRKSNLESGNVELSLSRDESAGTGKIFSLAGVWMTALRRGQVLVVDELEAKLHPLLTRFLIKLFNSDVANPHGAQLLFVTHDSNLMEHGGLRRDQIWFCEKNREGRSVLYSLAEIKEMGLKRKDSPIEKNYIEGKYGAVPLFGDWERLVEGAISRVDAREKGGIDASAN